MEAGFIPARKELGVVVKWIANLARDVPYDAEITFHGETGETETFSILDCGFEKA
jgi:hypothetical protein